MTRLNSVANHCHLGVTINSDLTWDNHVNIIISRANRMLGFISSTAGGSSPTAIFSLYKALIIPILEYGVPAWLPRTKKLVERIEAVQRRATRLILKQKRGEMGYEERLTKLNWPTLSDRRDFLLLSFVCKSLIGIVDCSSVRQFTIVNGRYPETLKFIHHYARTNCLHHSVIHLFPRLWEKLPVTIKNSFILEPFPTFVNSLKSHVLYS